jgi:hypothetical protein
MTMQLDTSEVQVAITEYLRKRGVIVENTQQVQLEIINHRGERLNVVGCAAVVVANNVKLPDEGPYR